MRRSVIGVVGALCGLMVWGCEKPKPEEEPPQDMGAVSGTDFYSTDTDASSTLGGPTETYSRPAPMGETPAGARTHVVEKGDTLMGLAREYYNDPRKWKDIFEANRDRIANKDRLQIGQELIIP